MQLIFSKLAEFTICAHTVTPFTLKCEVVMFGVHGLTPCMVGVFFNSKPASCLLMKKQF